MAVKYVFVTGGVVSGLGKGITAASLGRLLKMRGYKVTSQKFDPYINIDPGTMNPIQHGEVFVTDDGAETDLDLGHYERFIDESLNKNSNVTTGKVYWSILQKERHGDFGGHTVQVVPHITNEIKDRFYRNPDAKDTEVAIIEIGGTVGDIESQPFLEAIRQFQHEVGPKNCIMIHVTLIPYLKASGEIKTKPTQASVKNLQGMGIQPDILVCRSDLPLDQGIKDKIALFCNVPSRNVIQNLDVDVLYEVPLAMEKEHLADVVCECLDMECPPPAEHAWLEWTSMIDAWKHPEKNVRVALVGKYVSLHDAYISVVEALKHAGVANKAEVEIKWVDSELVTEENVAEIHTQIVNAISTHRSMIFSVMMLIGLIVDAIPSTIRMLNTLEPIALPSAISTSFFLAATIEVTSSGSDVPIETMVSPISVWLIPRSDAILDAASTVMSPPSAIAAAPPIMNTILSGIEISLISSSDPPSISTFLPSLLAFNAILII